MNTRTHLCVHRWGSSTCGQNWTTFASRCATATAWAAAWQKGVCTALYAQVLKPCQLHGLQRWAQKELPRAFHLISKWVFIAFWWKQQGQKTENVGWRTSTSWLWDFIACYILLYNIFTFQLSTKPIVYFSLQSLIRKPIWIVVITIFCEIKQDFHICLGSYCH